MKNVNHLWTRFATPRNLRILYLLATLAALAVAGGAPGAGSGAGGGIGAGSIPGLGG